MTETVMILRSEQSFFEALAIEAGRGLIPGLSAPSKTILGWLNRRTDALPQYVDGAVLEILRRDHGKRVDDDLVRDTAALAPALPPTGAIPVVKPSAILPPDPTRRSPAQILNEGKPARAPRKAATKRQPPGSSGKS